ncbi:MAG TPA: DUF177 domain-containing protein [Pseudonocardiaceae bacterium]|jgi:uncharacterized protein|nr:DUF177 domain-containing protein [Pseudonocardiaceae bacterium]
MTRNRSTSARPAVAGPWVIDTRDIGRRPGTSRRYHREAAAEQALGFESVITVPKGSVIVFDVLAESVVEGVLMSGTATATTEGECSRCLDPITGSVEIEFTELYAYPDSLTEATTDEDEVYRIVDDLIDLEPVIRDAIVLALPHAPLCSPDCLGLCPGCGGRRAELGPEHGHENIDPRWAGLADRFDGARED